MTRPLRIVLTLLVLANLLFVHATEAARLSWLVPMYALTIASFALAPLRQSKLYRAAWNAGVIAVFALLVRHTMSAGAAFLLEDGLRLAAICQVHLLNNLGARQKPDLLFFNSILIALVTSYLTQDVVYSAIFLGYAPLLVVGLAIHAASRHAGGAGLAPREVAVIGRTALARAGAVVAIALALFVVVPRDFSRRGFLGDRLDLERGGALRVDFDAQVELDRPGGVRASDRLVMRVEIDRGTAGSAPAHWRGATMAHFDGHRWRSSRGLGPREDRWRPAGGRSWHRDHTTEGPRLRVELLNGRAARLFLPLEASRVVGEELRGARVRTAADRTMMIAPGSGSTGPLRYVVEIDGSRRQRGGNQMGGAPAGAAAWGLASYRRLRPGTVPAVLQTHADQIAASLPAGSSQASLVEALRRWVSTQRSYLPPGTPEGGTFAQFAVGEVGGHCEHFATALALMLRHRGVACRLVTGYLSTERDDERGLLLIRERHAHAWVEVLDGAAGWYTVDPSPSAGDGTGPDGPTLVAMMRDALRRSWNAIVDFDAKALARVWASIRAAPGRLGSWAEDHPGSAAGILAGLAAALAALSLRRRRRVPATVRALAAASRAGGLARRPSETPRELLERARSRPDPLAAVALARLASAVDAHETARYAVAPRRAVARGDVAPEAIASGAATS